MDVEAPAPLRSRPSNLDKHTELYRRYKRSKEMWKTQKMIEREAREAKRKANLTFLEWFCCECGPGDMDFPPCVFALLIVIVLAFGMFVLHIEVKRRGLY